MSADEMFKELGYKIDINCLDIIRYAKHIEDKDYYIKFYLDDKDFDCNMIIDNGLFPLPINEKLLQAINKKCKELGWYR